MSAIVRECFLGLRESVGLWYEWVYGDDEGGEVVSIVFFGSRAQYWHSTLTRDYCMVGGMGEG